MHSEKRNALLVLVLVALGVADQRCRKLLRQQRVAGGGSLRRARRSSFLGAQLGLPGGRLVAVFVTARRAFGAELHAAAATHVQLERVRLDDGRWTGAACVPQLGIILPFSPVRTRVRSAEHQRDVARNNDGSGAAL